MKILVLFMDMLRANRLSTFNSKIRQDSPLDSSFRNLGGTVYINCFTPGPDTARGISAVTTGVHPNNNGCDVRLKWPMHFLKPELHTIYDLFIDKGIKIDILSDPRERTLGLFPKHINDLDIHNKKNYNIEDYLNNLVIEDDHFIFLCLPQFHWTLDAYGASINGEKIGLIDAASSFNKVFNILDKDSFDHIFIFSDHGFKFMHERKLQPDYLLLNEDRIHTVMIHRKKFQTNLTSNNKLCSIADLYPTLSHILDSEKMNDFSLLSEKARDYIVIEDHINFISSVNQNIELWAVVDQKNIYIRTLENGFLINRNSDVIGIGTITNYDKILEKETCFSRYNNEYKKSILNRKILVETIGMNYDKLYDFRRVKRSSLKNKFFMLKDILFSKVGAL